jgi:hypothetical protein
MHSLFFFTNQRFVNVVFIRRLEKTTTYMPHIKKVPVINISGFAPKNAAIPDLKPRNYVIDTERSVGGDRPKDIVRIYQYGIENCVRSNSKTWISYIAKVGDKWYPNESLMEFALNRIGVRIGMKMAESALFKVDGQIRFFSKIFTNKDIQLVHGSQIYANHLQDDAFVKAAEAEENVFFTFLRTADIENIKA